MLNKKRITFGLITLSVAATSFLFLSNTPIESSTVEAAAAHPTLAPVTSSKDAKLTPKPKPKSSDCSDHDTDSDYETNRC